MICQQNDLLKTSIYEITNDTDKPNIFSFLQNPRGSPRGSMSETNCEGNNINMFSVRWATSNNYTI